MRRALTAGAAWLALLAAPAAPTLASSSNESIFMDDPKIVYSAPENLEGTLAEIKMLGADRIRVSVFWHLLAPHPESAERPFAEGSGANPSTYSAEKWDRYDRVVTTAQKVGLQVLFNVTSPAPNWATPQPEDPAIDDTYRPSAAELRDFVKALGTRYSGTFLDEAPRQGASALMSQCDPTPTIPMPPPTCAAKSAEPSAQAPNPPNTGPILPRVDSWSIWNEPNIPGWLTPQWSPHPSRQGEFTPTSPHVYRDLADAMYTGLRDTGHGGDMILLAETAPRGSSRQSPRQPMAPLPFLRELYCLTGKYRHFTGAAAAARNCPSGGAGFAAAHPVLFEATGVAHHPYALEAPPGATDATSKDHVVLGDLDRLTDALDRAVRRHGHSRRFPLWLTEYGYQTDPPDPYLGWPWKTQARFLAEGEWLAYRHPRVRAMTQFLLYDDGPMRQYPANDHRHWGTFQTGIRTFEGKRKTAYAGYQRTIHVTPETVRRGRRITVFGLYRPATAPVSATVEIRPQGNSGWTGVRTLSTNGYGYLSTSVPVSRPGAFRIAFRAGDRTVRTRAASFRVSR